MTIRSSRSEGDLEERPLDRLCPPGRGCRLCRRNELLKRGKTITSEVNSRRSRRLLSDLMKKGSSRIDGNRGDSASGRFPPSRARVDSKSQGGKFRCFLPLVFGPCSLRLPSANLNELVEFKNRHRLVDYTRFLSYGTLFHILREP